MLTFDLSSEDRVKTSATSKGNQIKWFKDGYWFKADKLGYEGLAEFVAFNVLLCSNVPKELLVPYHLCEINEEGTKYIGCASPNFLQSDESLWTLGRLLSRFEVDRSLTSIFKPLSTSERVDFVLDFVRSKVGVDLTDYLRLILTVDAFLLNEDRHFHNIALVYSESKGFRPCPLFDNGLSLLSDMYDYPNSVPIHKNISRVKSKPFSTSFQKQLEVLGYGLLIDRSCLSNFITSNLGKLGRSSGVLRHQMVKYDGTIVF